MSIRADGFAGASQPRQIGHPLAYRPGLPARQVHARLQASLAALRRAERRAVLWFAEVVRRRLHEDLGYASVHQYAAVALGFSAAKTSQFLRLAEALDRLPMVKQELADGRIGWTKALEVVKVASARTEAAWLAEAHDCGRRALAERVKTAREAAKRTARGVTPHEQAELALTSASTTDTRLDLPSQEVSPKENAQAAPEAEGALYALTLRFSATQLAQFETLVERIRKQRRVPASSSREEIALASLAELAHSGVREARSPSKEEKEERDASAPSMTDVPPCQIVIHRCDRCGAASTATARGDIPLDAAALSAAQCDAVIIDREGAKRHTMRPKLRRRVLARDGHRCQTPGCANTRFLEVHHRVPLADGGLDDPDNLVTLCARCHRFMHEHGVRGPRALTPPGPRDLARP